MAAWRLDLQISRTKITYLNVLLLSYIRIFVLLWIVQSASNLILFCLECRIHVFFIPLTCLKHIK